MLKHAGANRMSAVAADEPSVLVGDHRPQLSAYHAMGAADDQDCVGRHRSPPTNKRIWHAGFQTPTQSESGRIDFEPRPAPTFGQACRQSGGSYLTLRLSSVGGRSATRKRACRRSIAISSKPTSGPFRWESALPRASTEGQRSYCSFAYSALACLKIGMSGSASFQSVRKS